MPRRKINPSRSSRNSINKKRRKKGRLSVTAVSSHSGISHHFNDLDALKALAKSYIAKRNTQFEADLIESLRWWNWLKSQPPISADFLSWNAPFYRIVYGGLDPLSLTGSLATGGRFNLGAAQVLEEELFPNVGMGGCLYGASSIECAKMEAGDFLGKAEVYRITPKQDRKLWKLEAVLKSFQVPALVELVRKTPTSQRWILQKTPLFSQLISSQLRSMSGDGLIFPSTKIPSENVLAFFAKDDRETHLIFECEKILI